MESGRYSLHKDDGLEFEQFFYEDDGKCHKFVFNGERGKDDSRVGSLSSKVRIYSAGST